MTLLMKIPMEMKETYLTIENKGVFRRGSANKNRLMIPIKVYIWNLKLCETCQEYSQNSYYIKFH